MLTDIVVEENTAAPLSISDEQAQLLTELGRRMAGRLDWWGAGELEGTSESEAPRQTPSIIKVEQGPGSMHLVTFINVIGAVKIGDMHLEVRPKIPVSHFRRLMKQADVATRVDSHHLQVDEDVELHELVCGWFVAETERLVRLGLNRDYSDYEDVLTEVRGRLSVAPTILANLSGRAVAHCEYSDLDEDTSLNRILKAASLAVARNPELSMALRQRGLRLANAMGPVGALRNADRLASVTRLTARYGRALPLARLVCVGAGVSSSKGSNAATGFLLPTPGIVESGLRNLIASALRSLSVTKRGMKLVEGAMTLNPDIVIDHGSVVGDVKYQWTGDGWDRRSLYQIVTFATGYRAKKGMVVGFSRSGKPGGPEPAVVGDISIRRFSWAASASDDPSVSETNLLSEISEWVT